MTDLGEITFGKIKFIDHLITAYRSRLSENREQFKAKHSGSYLIAAGLTSNLGITPPEEYDLNTTSELPLHSPAQWIMSYDLAIPLSSEPFDIGRGSKRTLRIKDTSLSRLHCIIQQEGSGYRVYDGSGPTGDNPYTPSTNGTYLDGVEVSPTQGELLTPRAVITFFDNGPRLTYITDLVSYLERPGSN